MPTFQCPRCGGTESFVRTETVLRAGRTNVVNTTKFHNVDVSSTVCKKCGEKMQTILTDYDKKLAAIQDLQTERKYWLFSYIFCCGVAIYLLIFSLNMLYERLYPDMNSYPLEPYQIGIAQGVSILFLYFGYLLRKPCTRLKNQILEEESALGVGED